jgi:hypothetical protein
MKPGSFLPMNKRGQRAADHGHEGVDRHQAGDGFQRLRRHDVEAEPAYREDPGAQGQERNAGGRMRGTRPSWR